jgi:medium-chain acyl-[acyl-carrier-protein] hydrolase
MMTSTQTGSRWLTIPRPNPRAALRLFCFPYAGGTAQIYREWPQGLTNNVEVCAVQLPGRGPRMSEPAFTNLFSLADEVAAQLRPHMDRPFAFFGHSMGAAIAFELTHRLRQERRPQPEHLFLSGRRAPQIPPTGPPTYSLQEPEFIEEVRQLKGTPREVLEHPELMELMIPVLRADFELIQTYANTPRPPLDRPFTVFGGLQDYETGREQLEAWREHTSAHFSLRMLPGDHFFLNSLRPILLDVLAKELTLIAARLGK